MSLTPLTLDRTGREIAQCPGSAWRGRWHWTDGSGQTLCGKTRGPIYSKERAALLPVDAECKLCARSRA